MSGFASPGDRTPCIYMYIDYCDFSRQVRQQYPVSGSATSTKRTNFCRSAETLQHTLAKKNVTPLDQSENHSNNKMNNQHTRRVRLIINIFGISAFMFSLLHPSES